MIDNSSMGDLFYCAPLFHTYRELESKYKAKSIINSSVWIAPYNTRIVDKKSHNITYDSMGNNAYLHSKTKSLKVIKPESPNLMLTNREIDSKYIKKFAQLLEESLVKTKYKKLYTSDSNNKVRDIEKIQNILGNIYRVSWVLI